MSSSFDKSLLSRQDRAIFDKAQEVLRSELRSYDIKPGKVRFVPQQALLESTPLDKGRHECAHSVLLHLPCSKCERSGQRAFGFASDRDDCFAYEQAFKLCLKELAAILSK